jgi:hypothetical protein
MPASPLHICLLVLGFAVATPSLAARWSEPEITGLVTDEALDEISGMAVSYRHEGMYWAVNDSGNSAHVHVMDDAGHRIASYSVEGATNIDWEDLASYRKDGRSYVVIADTGDNGGVRSELRLIAFEEPAELRDGGRLRPAWVQRFRWSDGARDCEAIAIDPVRNEILLVSKKRIPPELFSLPLPSRRNDEVLVPELLGRLRGITQPTAEDLRRTPVYGRYRSQITAIDLSPNGRVLAALTYNALYLYARPAGQSWSTALATPARISLPWLPQAEAVAFRVDGMGILIGSEQLPSPLLRYRVVR